MVRRGSTVRVRQRACIKALQMGLCCRLCRRNLDSSRVRDGYARSSTNDHAQALPTRTERLLSRTNALANDRACTPLPPLDLHGKEGVDGSSPSEGLYKSPANGLMLSSVPTQFGLVAGTRRVHFGTSGHARASAPSRGTSSNVLEAVHRGYSLGKLLQIDGWRCPPRSDADFLLVERGSAQAPTCRQPACHAGGRGFESRRSRSRNATANAGRLQLGAYA
jgi:hypothetical protein